MISKSNRLSEREVKKVLRIGKPFFSYGIVLNYIKNNKDFNRFAVVISGKVVNNNIDRNFFRRRFYDICSKFLSKDINYDFAFIIKKQNKLDRKIPEIVKKFKTDLGFLMKKIYTNK